MRHNSASRVAFVLSAALVSASLSSCSTSPVALEQANHTVGLMSELDKQLAEFRRVQSAAEQARLDSLRRQKKTLIRVDESAKLNAQASMSAGDTKTEPFAKKLLADADGLVEIKTRSQSAQVVYKSKLDGLLTPIPSTKESIAQAQTKAAILGRELDSQTRFDELQAFLTEIAENVKANRKKVAAAETDAAKAAAAAASAPAP